jgi:hypothetical protein
VVRGGGGSRCFVFEVDVVYCYSILNNCYVGGG